MHASGPMHAVIIKHALREKISSISLDPILFFTFKVSSLNIGLRVLFFLRFYEDKILIIIDRLFVNELMNSLHHTLRSTARIQRQGFGLAACRAVSLQNFILS